MSLQSELQKIFNDSRKLILGDTPPVVTLLRHTKGAKGYTALAELTTGWTIEKGNIDEPDHLRITEDDDITPTILGQVHAVALDEIVYKVQKFLASPIGAVVKVWTFTFEPPTGETYTGGSVPAFARILADGTTPRVLADGATFRIIES